MDFHRGDRVKVTVPDKDFGDSIIYGMYAGFIGGTGDVVADDDIVMINVSGNRQVQVICERTLVELVSRGPGWAL